MTLVEQTWAALGYQVEAVGYRLWVRTDAHQKKTSGGVWLAPKYQGFHGTLPHLVTIQATVLSAGPVGVATQFKPGDTVFFKRLHMGMWTKIHDHDRDSEFGEAVVGFIDANEVLGLAEREAA
jgi:hypothetical protein